MPYVVTARGTGLATVRRALEVLDYIAELKRSDALLCDVANWRISPRLLAREGWEPHAPCAGTGITSSASTGRTRRGRSGCRGGSAARSATPQAVLNFVRFAPLL